MTINIGSSSPRNSVMTAVESNDMTTGRKSPRPTADSISKAAPSSDCEDSYVQEFGPFYSSLGKLELDLNEWELSINKGGKIEDQRIAFSKRIADSRVELDRLILKYPSKMKSLIPQITKRIYDIDNEYQTLAKLMEEAKKDKAVSSIKWTLFGTALLAGLWAVSRLFKRS